MRPERLLLATLIVLGVSTPVEAQVREVVSSQVAVSRDDATLRLELDSDEQVTVSLREGAILVDGESVGSYTRGDALDAAWRSLLGDVVALDDGPLARALVDWSPPAGLQGDAADLAERLDAVLEERLSRPAAAPDPQDPAAVSAPAPASGPEVARLLRRGDRLGILAEAVEGMDLGDDVRIEVGRDVTVDEGEEITGSLVVVDGDLAVRGSIRGDVVVTGGELELEEGGRIYGDVRLADARLSRDGGRLDGEVSEISDARIRVLERLSEVEDLGRLEDVVDLDEIEDLEADIRAQVRDEIRREMGERGFWSEFGSRGRSPLASIGRGLGGLIETGVSFMVMLLLALGVIRFFPDNLALVEAAAQRNPVRAGLVGTAGAFLLVPTYVLGMLALVVSIVGIPALLAWIPLFPLAAALAAALGYLTVAILLGRWIIRQDFNGLDFLRSGNDLHAAAAGLGLLVLPEIASNIVTMGGSWLDFAAGLFTFVGVVAGVVVMMIGFGSVILTRGGRKPAYATAGFAESDWTPEPGAGPEAGWEEEFESDWEDLERDARRKEDLDPEDPAPDVGDDTEADGGEDERDA